MKRTLFQKVMCLLLSVTMLLGVFTVSASAGAWKGEDSAASTLEEMKSLLNASSYENYRKAYLSVPNSKPLPTITVDVVNDLKTGAGYVGTVVSQSQLCLDAMQSDPLMWSTFGEENKDTSVYLPAQGSATWEFAIGDEDAGIYYLVFEYYNCETGESSISSIERKLYIDGSVPFTEASYLTFPKVWKYNYVTEREEDAAGKPDGTTTEYVQRNDGEDKGYYKVVTVVKNGKATVTEYRIGQDINGNSMAPEMVQYSKWSTYYCQDTTGYYNEYFGFYLLNGTHTITLEAQREPMVVKSIQLVPAGEAVDIPTYEDVKADYAANGYKPGGGITTIQAEFPDFVSDNSVTAGNDNSSSATYPSSAQAQMYNVIGAKSYGTVGQYAAYKFTVDQDGLYKFGMRYKQNKLQGMYICRAIKLSGGQYGQADGTPSVPFAEAYNAQFNFSDDWQASYVGHGSGEEFEEFHFYFEKGVEYTLYLECSLGSLSDLIQRVQVSLDNINEYYLKILQLTGTEPDEYRDYKFYDLMPEVVVGLLHEAIELDAVAKEFEALCGKGSHIATLNTVAVLLDRMGSNYGDEIAANLGNLKSYLGTLGTWINNSKTGSMVVDSISVHAADADAGELPAVSMNFFASTWHEIKAFVFSFFTDYNAMGLTSVPDENTPTVEVWLATGRDQSQIWRTMIDAQDGFTEATGNAVTLKLVTGGTLLPSILAGKGPDVYIGQDAATVINYAIRDAVVGISGNDKHLTDEQNAIFTTEYYTYKDENGAYHTVQKEDLPAGVTPTFVSESFEKAVEGVVRDDAGNVVGENVKYVDAALDTLRLLGVTYGVPQGMGFAMMFYRTDALARLGQEVPETWNELMALLPLLQANNMSIGLSYASALEFFLYQMGGNMWRYTEDEDYAGARIGLNTDIALEAFDYVCRLYTDYSFPISYDASNRFRTGEMPIIINEYASMYNTLTVYATEIQGLWEFSSLPGYVRENEDGTQYLNYDSIAAVNATILLHGSDNMLAAWQFMQWQTGAKAQSEYGNQMVALIGPSAKYESANIEALENLSWTAKEKKAIRDQMNHLSSVVNYPGSYIISRYTKFAFLAATNDSADPVDALTNYIGAINTELARKRKEFDMPVLEYDVEDIEQYKNQINAQK